jgi:hypothetical protein
VEEIRMRYTGNANFQITQTPRGDWLALFDCPDRECSAVASASGANELGPYRGSCSSGHQIHIPYVNKS